MDYKKVIAKEIKNYIKENIENIDDFINIPSKSEMGDYAFPCFHISRYLNKSPNFIAEELKDNLKIEGFEKVETVGAYLNFYIDKNLFIENTLCKIKKEGKYYGNLTVGNGKTICIDYRQFNLYEKINHTNIFNILIGKSLYNLFKKGGYKVINISNEKECSFERKVKNLMRELEKSRLIVKNNEVQVVMLKEYNIPPCIIMNENEEYTHSLKKISSIVDMKNKYKFYKYICVDSITKQIKFNQLFKVLELLKYKWSNECIHAKVAIVKLNYRSNLIKQEDDVLPNLIQEISNNIFQHINLNNREEIIQRLSKDIVIFEYLKNPKEKSVVLNLENMISVEEGSALYIQYSYIRAREILKRINDITEEADFTKISSKEEFQLVNLLGKFQNIINKAIQELEPCIVTKYVIDVVRVLNKVCNNYDHMLNLENKKIIKARKILIEASCQVIKNALNIIEISVIDKI